MCKKCEHIGCDCVWDDEIGEDEIIYSCLKHHDIEFENESDCPYFKEFKEKKYKEKDTKCDKCGRLQYCVENGILIDCTTELDNKRHFIYGIGGCGREENV